jgi:V8-like Glu-specific endopeptidase
MEVLSDEDESISDRMVNLKQTDFHNLLRILCQLPEFQTARSRRLLLVAAGLDDFRILSRLELEGPPQSVAAEVLKFLATFGRVSFNREALGALLAYIREFIPDAESGAHILDNIIENYALNVGTSSVHAIDQWRDSRSDELIKEVIIGENTLRPIADLEKALLASDAVVHLLVRKTDGKACYGTGFMITPVLLMTNNHVIENVEEALATEYTFHYQLDIHGCEVPTVAASALSGGLFYTNRQLDFTIVELSNDSYAAFSPLPIDTRDIVLEQRVSIIQHPGGHPKKISMQNNHVAYSDRTVVQYYTSTLPGSSGSPVLNDDFDVIAIHHSGGVLTEPSTNRKFLRNAGSTMSAILDHLRQNAPTISSKIDMEPNNKRGSVA